MGPAGVSVVKTLRERGFNGSIDMFSLEKATPYSPPALGEYLVSGKEDILFRQGKNFCEKYDVCCHAGEKVAGIDPRRKSLETQNRTLEFDYLVIASGSSLYAPVKGSNKDGIYNFKTLEGADRIKQIAKTGNDKTAIITGGGFIGVEIALCLAAIGIKPVLLNRRGWIMPRLLDIETAEYVEDDLRSKGIDVMLNTEGKEFVGEERVEHLLTSDGKELKSDIYVAATGVKPNIDFIKGTDIEYDFGIIVNKKLQTKYPYIFACGDAAETIDFLSGKRKIHGLYPVATEHGKTAALNILGMDQEYEKQINMNSLKGLSFKIIVAGNLEGEEIKYKTKNVLRKIFVKDNRITGFVLLGDISNAGFYLSLLKKKENISKFKHDLLSAHFFTIAQL